jgi:hypothetical protein
MAIVDRRHARRLVFAAAPILKNTCWKNPIFGKKHF